MIFDAAVKNFIQIHGDVGQNTPHGELDEVVNYLADFLCDDWESSLYYPPSVALNSEVVVSALKLCLPELAFVSVDQYAYKSELSLGAGFPNHRDSASPEELASHFDKFLSLFIF